MTQVAVDVRRHGPTAVVTGAAQGIGAALARGLAERGFELVLVDRQRAPLERLGRILRADTFAIDLTEPDATDRVVDACGGREIGLLVNNAAISHVEPLTEADPAHLEAVVAVNVRVPLMLTRAFAGPMVARGRGGIMMLSSFVSFHGAPLLAAYAGSRGFTRAFGESLWDELRPHGVDVLVACPGATDTEGFRRTEPNLAALRGAPLATPTEVAEEFLDVFGKVAPTRLAGARNRLFGAVLDMLPRSVATRAVGANLRKLYRR